MEETLINMIRDKSKSASLKSTDVFRSSDPNAVITNIYIKKGIDAPDHITLVVGDKK